MTMIKLHIQLTALLFSLVFSNVVMAGETNKNENKNNRTGDTVSNADLASDANRNIKLAIERQTNTAVEPQHKSISEVESFQQMEEQWHRRRQEAFKQLLQNRNRQMNANPDLPADAQARRNEYIKHMEQRRELFNKMNEQRRREAEQRREMIRQKMHQTRNYSPTAANS